MRQQLAQIRILKSTLWTAVHSGSLIYLHFDHAGAANYLPNARQLIQESEYRAAFVNYANNPAYIYDYYKDLADNPRTLLQRDHDVFGDGSVKIISAPGHTPGIKFCF